MKSVLMATALTITLASSGALAHGDGHDEMMQGMTHGKTGHGHEHASAVGKPGDPTKATRTVEVVMSDDMRFTPNRIDVERGETVRFVAKNIGQVKHEMVFGSMKELKAHAAMMRKMPEMEHADPNMVSVAAGKTGELVWQFTKAGTFDFACLVPGHFDAGMRGTISVAAPKPASK